MLTTRKKFYKCEWWWDVNSTYCDDHFTIYIGLPKKFTQVFHTILQKKTQMNFLANPINISNHYVIYLKLIQCYWICISCSSIKLKNKVSPWGEIRSNYGMIKTRFIHSILSLGIYMSLFKGTQIFVVGPLSKILSLTGWPLGEDDLKWSRFNCQKKKKKIHIDSEWA